MNGKTILAFIFGAACGTIGTYLYMTKVKKNSSEPEYEEYVPEFFSNRDDHSTDKTDTVNKSESNVNTVPEISKTINNYRVPSGTEEYKCEEEGDNVPDICIVKSEEVENTYDYSIETLYYTADGVVIDTANERFPDVNKILGNDFMNHYGEDPNEPDIVYVKNKSRKTYYEICKDEDVYHDPHEHDE